ncbi:efflux RND transporter periplasmic adaptor subunit [Halomonas denitrificans]|nr:efflux RND transporter periplasmic adaptor subunit [Halomonas denitrificans]
MNRTIIIIALSAALMGCSKQPAHPEAQELIRPALTETVTTGAAASHHFYGTVRAANRADLSFRTDGRLTEVRVDKGDRVEAGQVLARLDDREAELALISAVAELRNVEADYRRAKVIFEKSQAISVADLDELKTRAELAQLRVQEADRALSNTTLVAPFTGYIGQRLVDNHTQVAANSTVFVIHDLEQLEVTINVPDRIVTKGGYQARGEAEIAALPGQRFGVEMNSFATEADQATQTYQVTFSFADLNGAAVLPGMAAKVIPFVDESRKQITVPLTAISPDNLGSQFVWVVEDDNTISRRTVQLGEVSQQRVAVTGLSVGDRVITAGVSTLKQGQRVNPVEEIQQ